MNIEIVYYYATKEGKTYRNFAIHDVDHDKMIPIRCALSKEHDKGGHVYSDLCNIAVARSEKDREIFAKERAEYRASKAK